jgi:hypothetical protein
MKRVQFLDRLPLCPHGGFDRVLSGRQIEMQTGAVLELIAEIEAGTGVLQVRVQLLAAGDDLVDQELPPLGFVVQPGGTSSKCPAFPDSTQIRASLSAQPSAYATVTSASGAGPAGIIAACAANPVSASVIVPGPFAFALAALPDVAMTPSFPAGAAFLRQSGVIPL